MVASVTAALLASPDYYEHYYYHSYNLHALPLVFILTSLQSLLLSALPPEDTFLLCLADDIGLVGTSGSHDLPGPNSNCRTVCSMTTAKYLLISVSMYVIYRVMYVVCVHTS